MRVVLVCLLVLPLIGMLPSAAAQGHAHASGDAGLLLIADTPEDGRTWVGDITHFSYVILAADGTPEPHHDVHVSVTLNGQTLYATEWAHDYDGVGGIDIAFPAPGDYNVTVTVPGDMTRSASFEGHVLALDAPVDAEIVLEAPEAANAGGLTRFTYHIADATGAIIPHTDALVEVRRIADDFPVLAVHTHTHEDPMSFAYAFEKSGPHLVTIVGYTAFPDEEAVPFHPVVKQHLVMVNGDARPTQLPAAPGSVTAAEATAADARYETVTAVDPASGTDMKIGPFSQARTSIVTYDVADHRLVQHLDYEATLDGPYGTIFHSTTLHEYDGVLELMNANQMLGAYTWTTAVDGGDWKTTRAVTHEVVPANLPLQAGPQFIDVRGLDRLQAGAPGTIDLFVHGLGDVPFQHSEVAFRLTDDDGVPILIHKVHTHATGTFAFDHTPGTLGQFTLQVDPFDVHGSPTPVYYGRAIEASRAVGFTVTTGTAVSGLPIATPDVQENVPVPAVGLALLCLVALAHQVGRRRP